MHRRLNALIVSRSGGKCLLSECNVGKARCPHVLVAFGRVPKK